MKNILTVDVDSERKPQVIVQNEDDEKEYNYDVVEDMATLCEGLCTLIHFAEQNGIKSSPESLRDCIKHLENGFADSKYTAI